MDGVADHAGGVQDFPNATLWVSGTDWDWGRKKRTLHGVEPSAWEGREARHPDYDDGPVGPFAAHADLFGDGTVRVVPAPGHTPGSQIVWVQGEQRSFVFLGDVAWIAQGVEDVLPKGGLARGLLEDDWKLEMDALARAHALLGQPGVEVVPGHEPTDVARFPMWPQPW